jgi:hypothetical protein
VIIRQNICHSERSEESPVRLFYHIDLCENLDPPPSFEVRQLADGCEAEGKKEASAIINDGMTITYSLAG